MHIGIQAGDMDPLVWKRLGEADTVIIETDLSQHTSTLMAKYMSLPPGKDLSVMLGAEHWQKFVKIVKESGSKVTEEYLKSLSPLAAGALLLQVQAKADEDLTAGAESIDSIIYERGRSLGKKLKTLETNEEQLKSLQAVFHIEAIQKVLDEWEAESGNYAELKKAFKEGNSLALDDMLKEVPEDMRHLLLEERNKLWILRLPFLQGKKTVLAVGAAHFAGEYGLLRLLKEDGYRITPIR